VANDKRQRQSANRAAREAQLQREASRRRWIQAGVVVVLVAVLVGASLAVFVSDDDSGDSNAASTSSSTPTTSQPAVESAEGKPCVAVSEPLPNGAPQVPVQEGAPPSELVVQDITEGTGATVEATSTVTVDYIGVSCSTGRIFDSSWSRGETATFPLNQVIPGWSQGLTGMKVGGQRLLGIPPDLAYGSQGSPPDIAPNETLWFVVDMRDAQAGTAQPTG
jgi:FKBP-type peptidyl-prolyl cis-trans isomerase